MSKLCLAQQSEFENNILFSHLTSRDGLSNDETTCIYEDKKGFIWIGTRDGLNFYSANQIVIYRNEPKDSSSLPDNIINSLAEDDSNHLWIASVRGLSKMNLSNRRIEKIYHYHSSPDSLHASFLLLYDHQGRLWSADNGLDLFDPAHGRFIHYFNQTFSDDYNFKLSNGITALFQDNKDRIWVGTHKGLYLFNPSTGQFTAPSVQFVSGNTSKSNYTIDVVVTEVMQDHQNQLWIGTWGNGLIKFFPEENKMVSFPVKLSGKEKNSEFNIVSKISETKDTDDHYHLWVSTDQGFAEFKTNNEFTYHVHSPQDLRSPSSGAIRQLYASSSGILWIPKETEGVDLMDPHRQVFKTHFFDKASYAPAVQFGSVNSILSASDSIWIATWYGNAVYLTDKKFNILRKWQRFPPASASEENNRGTDIFRDKRGMMWVSTLNGLQRYDLKTGSFKSYVHSEKDSTSIPRDRVIKYFEDSEGIGWVFFYKRGFCKFNSLTGKFYDYRDGVRDAEGHIAYFNFWDVIEDHEHNLWLADDTQGLWKYIRSTKEFKRVFIKELSDAHVATVTEDTNHVIWVTTRNGLGRIENNSFQLLTQADGLPTNTFFAARTDKQNRLWILSNQGMILYDEKSKIIKVLKEDDGLEKIPVDGAVLYRLADGRMVIGGNHYITEFDPARIALNNDKPPVYITDFKLFGKSYDWSETKKGKLITLRYDQNQFSFDFAVLNYSNAGENKFYYRLVGLDKTWKEAEKGFANYTNLDEGEYTFKVKGSNSDGAMNEEGDFIIIKISPPFWRTWWFIGLCIIAIFSLVYILFRYRLKQALKLERLRTRISADLHDDIGSTLSSISILSNMALKEGIDSSAREMIAEIKDNSSKLMERIDDIVWSINPENDTLIGLLMRIKQFSSKLFEVKGIDYEFEIPSSIQTVKLSMEYNQHIYLILKEAINNMVKYSGCTRADIAITFAASNLRIKIIDNGKGFNAANSFSGNGIKSMKNRAQLMSAVLDIESHQSKGTSITLSLKIK